MPAGTNLIVYAPCKGVSGDDRYDYDTVYRKIIAGSSAGFSSPPTIAEINASSGINQIIAEINRRNALYYDTYNSGTHTPLSYVVSGTKAKASDVANLMTAIDTIRAREGYAAYSWSTTPLTKTKPKAAFIFDLRKALATDKFVIQSKYNSATTMNYKKTGYPADTSGTFTSSNGTTAQAGQRFSDFLSPKDESNRALLPFLLPSYLPTLSGVGNLIYYAAAESPGTVTYAANLEAYLSNSYVPSPGSGDWNHLDTLLTTQGFTPGVTASFQNIPFTGGSFTPGANVTIEFCVDDERTDTGHATGAGVVWVQRMQLSSIPSGNNYSTSTLAVLELYTP